MFEELEAEALGRQPSGGMSSSAGDHQQAVELATPPSAVSGNLWTAAELNGALPALPTGLGDFELSSGGDGAARPAASSAVPIGGSAGFNPLEAYGLLPTTLAEQVCLLQPQVT